MGSLSVTLIDVGWGDSVFIEHVDDAGHVHRALIDSNDTENYRSSYIFLKKYIRRVDDVRFDDKIPNFDFVMVSHWHEDHISGLKRIIRDFGTNRVYYPKSNYTDVLNGMKSYVNRLKYYRPYMSHQSVDTNKIMEPFGDVSIRVLWPPLDHIEDEENNNSIVLLLQYGDVKFILTGDAEATVWRNISDQIPADTRFFKVPHHGSRNGTFDGDQTPWLDELNNMVTLGISGHVIGNFNFPHPEVIDLFNNRRRDHYRTDNQYHLTFTTDGVNDKMVDVQYSRF